MATTANPKATPKTDAPAKPVKVNLSQKQVMAFFGITHMTAYHWRTKEVSGRPVIPHASEGRHIIFPAEKVVKWADKHEVPRVMTLDKVMKLGLENRTSGRPAKVKAKAKA